LQEKEMTDKQPFIPPARDETIRQSILALLRQGPATVRQISEEVGIAEKNVYHHLEHIRQSLQREDSSLSVLPSACRQCGFEFSKRQRLKKPGRCPLCRSESISQPRYRID